MVLSYQIVATATLRRPGGLAAAPPGEPPPAGKEGQVSCSTIQSGDQTGNLDILDPDLGPEATSLDNKVFPQSAPREDSATLRWMMGASHSEIHSLKIGTKSEELCGKTRERIKNV